MNRVAAKLAVKILVHLEERDGHAATGKEESQHRPAGSGAGDHAARLSIHPAIPSSSLTEISFLGAQTLEVYTKPPLCEARVFAVPLMRSNGWSLNEVGGGLGR